MKHKFTSLFVVLTFAVASTVNAGISDFYVSFSDLADGANAPTNTNGTFDLASGVTSGSAYIWINDGQNITGAFLDFVNSNTSVAAVTGFEVFNADIEFQPGVAVGERWDQSSLDANDSLAIVSDSGLEGIRGFAVIETGINGNPANLDDAADATNGTGMFTDALFVPGSGYLYGRVDFDILAVGTSAFDASASENFGEGAPIVGDGVLLTPSFGGATLNVIDSSQIPEPTGAAVLGILGCLGLVRRKR